MFWEKKQQILLSLDLSVNIICSDTKNSTKLILKILGNSFDLFPRTRGMDTSSFTAVVLYRVHQWFVRNATASN